MVGGRDFVIPEDAKRLAVPVLSHRILMKDRRALRGDATPESKLIQRIVNEVPGVNRIAYDITTKPPATVEWE